MLKTSLKPSRVITRSVSSLSATSGSDLPPESRDVSLQINDTRFQKAVLNADWKYGPPSFKSTKYKVAYNSPIGLKEVFPHAMKIIEKERINHYVKVKELRQEREQETDGEKQTQLDENIEKHLVQAEIRNPEVLFNHRLKRTDLSLSIYRHLAKRDWRDYEMLIMLQRLETMHVIPDTMPTIDPRAAVRVQFPGFASRWTEPGKILRNAVCAETPIVEIQEFEKIKDNSLYTVLVVDPDTPDIPKDRYKTTLHWAVSNIPLSNTEHRVDLNKSNELVTFLPPHPEKNGPVHRYCLWAFRQPDGASISPKPEELQRDGFDIRKFSETHRLDPVGAHFWRCGYDLSTQEVRDKYGLGEGVVFYKERSRA
jgi:large subunit ribosomal protein L35